jgi:hypothetical protein
LGKREEERGGEKIVKRTLLVLTVALVMAAMLVAIAMPAFARITTVTTHENRGGHTPSGEANGVPTVTYAENPAHHRPPGQQ